MTYEIGGRGRSQNISDSLFAPRQTANSDTPQLYEFGPFRLEPGERKLFRGNEVVVLRPKAFDMLVLSVRNSGHLLEKEELVRMPWPDTFVGEGNLSNNIFPLRKALGEDPSYMLFLGYRHALALRLMAGVLEFIPVAGWITALITIATVGMATHSDWNWMAALLGLWRMVMDDAIAPRVVGHKLEMHPLLAIFTVMVGSAVGAIVGIYLTLPLVPILRVIWHTFASSTPDSADAPALASVSGSTAGN